MQKKKVAVPINNMNLTKKLFSVLKNNIFSLVPSSFGPIAEIDEEEAREASPEKKECLLKRQMLKIKALKEFQLAKREKEINSQQNTKRPRNE